ncbi:hypothetical protein PSET11_00247 [Arthrobacter ulcerisalmonis]|uniref:DNA primase/nucleoside triphosphatase C-terminal domain-containing protein n=2 Tax=Arthrobacter ulcerisalmonis TaxID=2483813 RepID=A0A3P5WB14_9MICC|nr:hypothetical protein PSET11_00247 [Arthrobacter ulcerisalmonis]
MPRQGHNRFGSTAVAVQAKQLGTPSFVAFPMEVVIAHEHITAFLGESVSADPGAEQGLTRDELYGLYTSWCLLNQQSPSTAHALWAALREHRINPDHNALSMTGPAATDYILSSAPSLS